MSSNQDPERPAGTSNTTQPPGGTTGSTVAETSPVSREAGRLMSSRAAHVDAMRTEHQGEKGDPGVEKPIDEAQQGVLEGERFGRNVQFQQAGSGEGAWKPSGYEMDPDLKKVERDAASEIGQSAHNLKEPGAASREELKRSKTS